MVCGDERCCVPICTSFPILLLRLDQQRALGGIVTAWLFDVDVLARLQSRNRHRRVPVIGSGDGDCIHVFLLEDPAKSLSVAGVSQLLLDSAGKFPENIVVHIAHMRDAGSILVRLERGKMSIGSPLRPITAKLRRSLEPRIRA